MKIRYKTIVRPINTDTSVLIKNIISELDKPRYEIINQTQTSVAFKYNIWRFGSRSETFSSVDGGVFDIISTNKTILFSFFISPTFEVFAAIIVTYLGIMKDYHIFIFIIFIAVMFTIRIASVKLVANRMMDNILDS